MLRKSLEELGGRVHQSSEEETTHARHVQRRVAFGFQLTKSIATHSASVRQKQLARLHTRSHTVAINNNNNDNR